MIKRHIISMILMASILGGHAQVDQVHKPKEIHKATISFRIGPGLYLSDARYQELLGLFDKYQGVTDEVTFFTDVTHAPLPLPVFKDRVSLLKDRIRLAKKHGYRSGINILTTIGHHEENLENSLSGDYTYMTDIDGNFCKGSYCPNDKNYQEYIKTVYREMALADPDYIWIDDDIRLAGHMPIYLTCFCDNCLSTFEKEFGTKYTREEFKQAVDEGTPQEKLRIRKQWLAHNRNTVANLFKLIEKTVHELRPGLPLGFMTGDRFYEGYDFDNWADILSGDQGSEVLWRPGGGFYNDDVPAGMVGKSHDIGRQVSVLPDYINNIQSEIENYTYQRLSKSASMTSLEAASHIGAGTTGAAFNVLTFYDESLDEYEPLVAKLFERRPFYDLMVQKLGRSKPVGIGSYWTKDSFADGSLHGGSWFTGGVSLASYSIDGLGLPTAYSTPDAQVIKLVKDNLNGMTPDDITKLLSRGVYMEAEALAELNRLGYGSLTGFEIVGEITKDGIERFTEHELNAPFFNSRRDARQANYKGAATLLRKTDSKAEVLADLVNYGNEQTGKAIMGIFENKLGGRICVAGYHPWSTLNSLSKSSQIKSIFKWLSKDMLPGYVNSFHKMNLWIREPGNGPMAMALVNASFDEAEQVELNLKGDMNSITVYDMDCNPTVIQKVDSAGPYQRFVIPQVQPWQMRLIVCE